MVSQCQTDHLGEPMEHRQNVCIESLQGLTIPWPKPQNSTQPETCHKGLSQISDIPISARLSGLLLILALCDV